MAVNIRKFVLQAHSLDELVALGTLTPQVARFLEASVAAGLNILVSGGTQAGKATLAICLAQRVRPVHWISPGGSPDLGDVACGCVVAATFYGRIIPFACSVSYTDRIRVALWSSAVALFSPMAMISPESGK